MLALALVVSAVFSGCIASGGQSSSGTLVAGERALVTTTTVLRVDTPEPKRTSSPAKRARVSTPRPPLAPATGGSPWARYEGQLTGGVYVVAQAVGAGLHVSPSPGVAPAAALSNPLPSGAPRVLLVVGEAADWLQVLLPVRPNSSVGWIRRSDVSLATVPYRVEIDRAAHRIRVFHVGDAVVVDEPIAVGKPSTPTPTGQFFTIELLQPPNPAGPYGPYALTLSAYSDVYQTFGSGDGAVGVHGTNEPSSIGRGASQGCVRLRNDVITRVAGMLPLGTPVFIR